MSHEPREQCVLPSLSTVMHTHHANFNPDAADYSPLLLGSSSVPQYSPAATSEEAPVVPVVPEEAIGEDPAPTELPEVSSNQESYKKAKIKTAVNNTKTCFKKIKRKTLKHKTYFKKVKRETLILCNPDTPQEKETSLRNIKP